jgi:putative acetyltransferase
MSVGERWRGLGVGGALLEASATWAGAHAVSKLALGVFPENQRAIGFYERYGFVREGLRRAQYVRAGRYHDEVLMARFLTPVS